MNRRRTSPRSRRRRRIVTGIALAALAGLVVLDHRGLLLARGPGDMAVYHGVRAHVIRVIDGNTIEVRVPDRLRDRPVTLVRLWGVDCPRPAGRERRAAWLAGEARDLAATLAAGRSVVLNLETHCTRDPMGSVLAHVRLPGGTTLNERVLAAGLARTDERRPHARLTRYAQVERAARRQGMGMWGKSDQLSVISCQSECDDASSCWLLATGYCCQLSVRWRSLTDN